MTDLMQQMGAVFLGSRLKRLGERMQAGAARITADAGLPVQPSHMAFLAALDGQAMTIGQLVQAVGVSQPGVTRSVGQLVELGLAQSDLGEDQRQRTISLTPAGTAVLARAKLYVWPQVEEAVHALFGGRADSFVDQITELEAALEATPIDLLASRARPEILTIREYSDDLAPHFHDINAEWINAMFRLESIDREVLENPRAKIIEPGGVILFVEAKGLGIVGTCALLKTGANSYELTKMGVRESARGLKAGEFLLSAVIDRAMSLNADPLYLLTNAKCAAAIHLYEKLGFQHDAEIMARYGALYARCNVAMRYRPDRG
ncbi:bifunctional helix-turn-helix transcriptional regulator/GNAT family N-acetyltransferase [Sphingomonas sp. BT-65]|uniref:bifunctional helix-turn-helix transcriptional regulator/GNAT family N-acetyltransferase n=1 Tax=Sphingomonas sp. BT-65 TaxID=2989821 RepID=UPI0022366BC5|nr:bifunctional helix-turn-helix transcriptional regulator/GNAT family N-acetyltransferase [Sphingomonas sp. BT-65]MCW4460117.1 bifunctional helix-turn-helix transcriptional regulator/GNAT family N-acetyltransferase [Sphingomonas sp. BT-65]